MRSVARGPADRIRGTHVVRPPRPVHSNVPRDGVQSPRVAAQRAVAVRRTRPRAETTAWPRPPPSLEGPPVPLEPERLAESARATTPLTLRVTATRLVTTGALLRSC